MSSLSVAVCQGRRNLDLRPEMHRLRYRVFHGRLDWEVTVAGDMEIDDYDALDPAYLLVLGPRREVLGCARLLRTTGSYMLRDTFPVLLGGVPAPASPRIWESTRFCIDTARTEAVLPTGLRLATPTLLAGMLEWALAHDLSRITTVTDPRMARILARCGWPLHPYAPPQRFGAAMAVAGEVEVSAERLADVRRRAGLSGPVLIDEAGAAAARVA